MWPTAVIVPRKSFVSSARTEYNCRPTGSLGAARKLEVTNGAAQVETTEQSDVTETPDTPH
jgi:hypothetical protein